ncbi:cupredoxin domain-containing protein [Ilumatobacter sp.]|uniref:cupredoxin domain-containing protein n=1 Tax=Ilumatobacter sp. TaxID=1967498 RepID=UPI003C46F584
MKRLITLAATLTLFGVACAPDPPDTYTSPDAAPETLPPLPTDVPLDEAGESFPANGTTTEVRALDNSFVAQTVEVAAGTEVRWLNGGRNDHDVLPVEDDLDWGVDRGGFAPTEEYSHLFDQPGVYRYYCSIHGTKDAGMVGAIVVTEPA